MKPRTPVIGLGQPALQVGRTVQVGDRLQQGDRTALGGEDRERIAERLRPHQADGAARPSTGRRAARR